MPTQIITGFVNGQKYELHFGEDTDEATVTRATEEFFANLPIIGVPGTTSDLFEAAAQYTLEEEGVFSDDPDDKGGKTKFGISQRSFPDVDIDNLTREGAKGIYNEKFWVAPGFNLIPSDVLAVKTFDTGVNMGPRAAGKLLQRALNDVSPAEEPLVTDGQIGAKSLARMTRVPEDELLSAYVKRLKKRYGDIVENDPSQAKFLRGWTKRAERLPNTEGQADAE
jgi:lysozyme family protein